MPPRRRSSAQGVTPQSSLAPLAVGHRPPAILNPTDERLFRAFQSNLLSLISHELRTPLTGILNSLSLLDDPDRPEALTEKELVSMARRNAERLRRSLSMLLDLGSIDAGSFQGRLREVDFVKLIRVAISERASELKNRNLQIDYDGPPSCPVLADARYLSRGIDLALDAAMDRAERDSEIQLRLTQPSDSKEFGFEIIFFMNPLYQTSWEHASEQLKIGALSGLRAFAHVVGSEEQFLSRSEEGLGSEFLLLHEILKMHKGRIDVSLTDHARLTFFLPKLEDEDALESVLRSRSYTVAKELGSVSLVLIGVPRGDTVGEFCQRLRSRLFRASDGAYAVSGKNRVALVLDDCKPEDVPRLLNRLSDLLQGAPIGIAHGPTESLDPVELLGLAESRLVLSANLG